MTIKRYELRRQIRRRRRHLHAADDVFTVLPPSLHPMSTTTLLRPQTQWQRLDQQYHHQTQLHGPSIQFSYASYRHRRCLQPAHVHHPLSTTNTDFLLAFKCHGDGFLEETTHEWSYDDRVKGCRHLRCHVLEHRLSWTFSTPCSSSPPRLSSRHDYSATPTDTRFHATAMHAQFWTPLWGEMGDFESRRRERRLRRVV